MSFGTQLPPYPGHILHVGIYRFAQVRNLVDEADFHREEGVRGIFGQFRRPPPGEQDRRAVEEQRTVDFLENFLRALVLGAHDDAVRVLEVGDGRAFPQELGI